MRWLPLAPDIHSIGIAGRVDLGPTIKRDLSCARSRQLVDDGVRRPTEDSREAATERRLCLQAQIPLHRQRKSRQSHAVGRESPRQLGHWFSLHVVL